MHPSFLIQMSFSSSLDPLRLKNRQTHGFDIRNADPGPGRYTSLAWAVVYGHEEIFEYLLNLGHDEEELSRVSTPPTHPLYACAYGNPYLRTRRTIRY